MRFKQLDALRAVAALWVCVGHLNFEVTPNVSAGMMHFLRLGGIGVFMFFIISGFVIPYSLYKGNYKINNFGRYFLRRSIRIDIPYWLSIVLCVICITDVANSIDLKSIIYHLIYGVPFIPGAQWYNGAFWTLAVEMQFYIILGVLYPALMRLTANTTLILLTVLSVLCFHFAKINRGIFLPNLGYFVIGFLIFKVYMEQINIKAALLCIAIISADVGLFISLRIGVFLPLIALFILALRMKRLPAIVEFLAAISYSLYLTHSPILHLFVRYMKRYNLQANILYMVTILVCIAAATGFYFVIERPARLLSKRIKGTA